MLDISALYNSGYVEASLLNAASHIAIRESELNSAGFISDKRAFVNPSLVFFPTKAASTDFLKSFVFFQQIVWNLSCCLFNRFSCVLRLSLAFFNAVCAIPNSAVVSSISFCI